MIFYQNRNSLLLCYAHKLPNNKDVTIIEFPTYILKNWVITLFLYSGINHNYFKSVLQMTTIKKIFKNIIPYLLTVFFGFFLEDIYVLGKYRIFPEQDQLTKIERNIEELTRSIKYDKRLITWTNDPDKIEKYLFEIVENTKKLNENVDELIQAKGNSENPQPVLPNAEGEIWRPWGRVVMLDPKSSFSIVGTGHYQGSYNSVLNGEGKALRPGARIEYENHEGRKCYINFLGVEGRKYGISTYCD